MKIILKKETQKNDTMEKPEHYKKGIDTFERMEANCSIEECLAFAKGNIDKYNWRSKGQDLEDLNKIIAYAKWSKHLLTKKQETKKESFSYDIGFCPG